MQTVPQDLMIIRPTVAASVPRLYEKIYARILETVENAPKFRRNIFAWAVRIGKEMANVKMAKKSAGIRLKIQFQIASFLVFKKLKRQLGGKIRFFISGGAPLSKELAEFFYYAGVLILEGYGLTETSPVMTVNSIDEFKFGTVGKAIPDVQVKIAGDGEIMTAGPCVMRGYFRNEAATAEAFDGPWFKTGDIGA